METAAIWGIAVQSKGLTFSSEILFVLTALVSIFPSSFLPNATLHWSTALPPSLIHSLITILFLFFIFSFFRKSQTHSPSPHLSLFLSYPPPSPKTDLRLTLTLSLAQKVVPASEASPSSRAIQGTHTLTPPLPSHSEITFSRLLLFEIKRTLRHRLGRVCHSCPWRLSGGIGPAQCSVWVKNLGGFFSGQSPPPFSASKSRAPPLLRLRWWYPLGCDLEADAQVTCWTSIRWRQVSAEFLVVALVFCPWFVLFSYEKFTVFHSLSLSHKWCSGALYLFYTSLPCLCFGNTLCAWKCKW